MHAADKIVRHAEIKAFRRSHFQRKTAFALPLDFLHAGQLKLAVVSHIVTDHFVENIVNENTKPGVWPTRACYVISQSLPDAASVA